MGDLPLDPKALEKAQLVERLRDFLREKHHYQLNRIALSEADVLLLLPLLEAAPQPATGDALAYEPQVIRYDEGGFYEFVTADVSTVIREMDGYSLVLDLETRRPIGVRWPVRPQPVPDYPEGVVIGPCICGSWPGGPCLRCPTVPSPEGGA